MNRGTGLGSGRWAFSVDRAPFLLWIGFTLAYSFFAVMRHLHFETSGMDLGIFDQAVWHYSRFEAPASTINPHSNLLGDHFHPLLMVLAPLYWFFPHVETLLIAQVFLLTLAVFPLYAFALKRVGRWPA